MTYNFQVTFIDRTGNTKTVTVEARHEFEAVQLAGAFGLTVISVINLDI